MEQAVSIRFPVLFEGRARWVTEEEAGRLECRHMRAHAACFCGDRLSEESAKAMEARDEERLQKKLREVVDRLAAVGLRYRLVPKFGTLR